jgi:hypothetical protein
MIHQETSSYRPKNCSKSDAGKVKRAWYLNERTAASLGTIIACVTIQVR